MLRILIVLSVITCTFAAPHVEDLFLPKRYDGEPIVPMLDGRIVGGSIVSIANFPYITSLILGNSHICGASIISNVWTVTAAHCIVGQSAANLRLRAGSNNHGSGGALRQVNGGSIHGSYSSSTLDFDIAVLRVSSNFPLGSTGVQTINLPPQGSRPANGVNAVVSGWGRTSESGPLSAQLRAVTVPIISQASCRSSYGQSAITDRMLCAGFANGGQDACQGDSGGPLVIGNTLVGVVSWGRGCARPNSPGVYARVGSFRTWINQASGV